MNPEPEQPPFPVVLAPEVIALSLVAPSCRSVLERWRDGYFTAVVTEDLLRLYFHFLKALTIPDAQLRRWALWLTHKDRSRYIPSKSSHENDYYQILFDAARQGGATAIISAVAPPQQVQNLDSGGPIPWYTVNESSPEHPLADFA